MAKTKEKIEKIFKQVTAKIENEEGRMLDFTITTDSPDRDNDVIELDGWQFDNYLKNPVVLWAHRYDEPAVGKTLELKKEGNGIKAKVEFATAEENPFAEQLYRLYKNGFMSAVSVGFIPLEYDNSEGGYHFKKQELLEFSLVPVPANPEALVNLAFKGLEAEGIDKTVISYGRAHPNGTPLAAEDTEWNGSAEVRNAEVDDLKVMCTWYDSENPDVKASYKLPHHKSNSSHTCVWRGVAAAMAALMGARGGVDIPEDDRRGVYNHLAKHYKEFDKEPPEFQNYNVDDPKKLIELIEKCYNIVDEQNPKPVYGKDNDVGEKKDEELEQLKKLIKEEVEKIWK
jgi:HK97 family phage prohead protease